MAPSEKLSSLFCEAGARLWWGRLRHIWSFKLRRKSTTKGRALLWHYWLLLFIAHDAEWHKEGDSALVLYGFSCMWRLARDLSVALAQRHPCQQSAVGPVVSNEQTVWYWHTEISNWGIFTKACKGDILCSIFFSLQLIWPPPPTSTPWAQVCKPFELF